MKSARGSRGQRWTARGREHAKEYAEQFAEERPRVLAARAGDPDGLRWLCDHTERARREASRFYLPGRPDQWPDAENVGWIGVMDALARWNVGAGIRFLDYAVHHIGNRIREFAQAHRSPVRRPAWLFRAYRKMERLVEEGLDWDEVVQRSGRSDWSVASIVSVYREDMSLHARLGPFRDEDGWTSLDLLPAPEESGTEGDWERKDRLFEIKMILSQLEPQAQRVVRLSFGLDREEGDPMRAREVAKRVGLTTKRVESILSDALKSMRLSLLRQERCHAIHPLPTGVGVHQLREPASLDGEFVEEIE
ncbi:MAG: sigma-70 family RNA polymerase sigma factor [Methylacidiphilaceae bacterium]|nr:sigma-70 family RNA polymerase sigma factor [Candidatus Methylacidiphilaceae bacterium]